MHLEPGPLVIVLVLVAAVMHATWNAMAHAAADRLVGFALISLTNLVLGAVLIAASHGISGHYLAYAAGSAALHVAYMLLLWASYQGGDLSRSYPLARGTGVALTAVASFFVPRSPLGPTVVVGVLLVVGGLVGVTLAGPRPTRADARGITAALATGAAIAGYTVIDGVSVSGGAPVVAYAGWLFLLQGWAMPVLAVVRRGKRLPGIARTQLWAGLGGGVVSLAAYGLVLWAQTSGALAAIAALRELSIAVGVLLGATVLHEAAARKRVLPAVAITAGAVVLALSI